METITEQEFEESVEYFAECIVQSIDRIQRVASFIGEIIREYASKLEENLEMLKEVFQVSTWEEVMGGINFLLEELEVISQEDLDGLSHKDVVAICRQFMLMNPHFYNIYCQNPRVMYIEKVAVTKEEINEEHLVTAIRKVLQRGTLSPLRRGRDLVLYHSSTMGTLLLECFGELEGVRYPPIVVK